jgi:hypothetical protein
LFPSKYFYEIFAEIMLSYNGNETKKVSAQIKATYNFLPQISVSSSLKSIDDERGWNP